MNRKSCVYSKVMLLVVATLLLVSPLVVAQKTGGEKMPRKCCDPGCCTSAAAGNSDKKLELATCCPPCCPTPEKAKHCRMIMRAPVYLDSPAIIIGQAEKLQLSDEQKESLKKIEQDARERALAVLTAAQREKLGKIPDKPISLAQVCADVGTVIREKSQACCTAAGSD